MTLPLICLTTGTEPNRCRFAAAQDGNVDTANLTSTALALQTAFRPSALLSTSVHKGTNSSAGPVCTVELL